MRSHVLYIAIFFILTACTGAWETYPPQSVDGITVSNTTFQVGDTINVSVFGEEGLSGDYIVAKTGHITMPLSGDVLAVGLDQMSLAHEIRKSLIDGRYLINPEITVSIAKDRLFAIMGEVLNSGEYPYKNDMTILDAVARGGGFSYRANQATFDIVRKMPDGSEQAILAQLSTRIASGDIIRVRERFF